MKPITIAVAGKGGVGKTTLSSLIIARLLRENNGAILAVDADANANLDECIGIKAERNIGGILHSFMGDRVAIPPSMTKDAYLDVKLNEALIEAKGLDLMVMGRKEGSGCYCYPNSILRRFMDMLMPNYRYIVMDNEAGMEHLSRKTTDRVDILLIVTDPSVKGARTAGRMKQIVDELKLSIGRMGLVIGRYQGPDDAAFDKEVANTGLELLAKIPYDESIFRRDLAGEPVSQIAEDAPASIAVENLLKKLNVI